MQQDDSITPPIGRSKAAHKPGFYTNLYSDWINQRRLASLSLNFLPSERTWSNMVPVQLYTYHNFQSNSGQKEGNHNGISSHEQ